MRARATMLSLVFLFTLLGSSLSGSLTVAAAPEYWAVGRTDEPLAGDNRRIVLVVPVGDDGMIRYGGSEVIGYSGPCSFVVTSDGIFILDGMNRCVHIWKGHDYSQIKLSDYDNLNCMTVQNERVAVCDFSAKETVIYSTEGEHIVTIPHMKAVERESPGEITYIGEQEVEWRLSCEPERYFLYNWESGILKETTAEQRIIRKVNDKDTSVMRNITICDLKKGLSG